MKYLASLVLLLAATLTGWAQAARPAAPKFDTTDFAKKFAVAQWLAEYDEVAWKTTDVMLAQDQKDLARLGAEWFCFKTDDGLWHAVYGKYADAKFDQVFHLTMDKAGKVALVKDKLADEFLLAYAQALRTAQAEMQKRIPEGAPRFNQYIRRNDDKTFVVWLLPAFQTNAVAVYGGEFIYTTNAAGDKITADESYLQANFRGFATKPPREIWLNYRELQQPTLGAIFFAWYYRPYFTKIFIDTTNYTSALVKTADGYVWAHVEKTPPKQ